MHKLAFAVTFLVAAPLHAATPDVAAIAAHYKAWLPLHPIAATELGLHDPALDGALPSLDLAAERAILAELDDAQSKLDAAGRAPGCDAHCKLELDIVRSHIASERSELVDLREMDRWAGSAPGLIAGSVFPIIKRDFAPLQTRAGYAVSRLDAVPHLLDQALARLRTSKLITKISIEIALEDLPGTASFLEKDVPSAFDSLTDVALKQKVHASGKRAADALRAFGKALDKEIAPHASTSFALGAPLFGKLLATQEMIDEPLPALLKRGEDELARLQAEFKRVARRIDGKKEPLALKVELGHDHVPAGALLADVRARLDHLRKFVVDKNIAGIPTEVLPTVDETPPFMRATTQASMDTPGPYEKHATEAYYHVTLPDPHWDAARTEDYLGGAFNRSLSDIVSIHEALPGHYVQILWMQHIEAPSRRMQGNGAYIEGWAHYCEEMMLDEGWGKDGAPGTVDKLRLMQLSDALLRAARYVVAIRMHTPGPNGYMTLEQAKQFFEHDGYQSREVALIEAKRGTEDPMYLHYTWGKLELKRLRDDLRVRWGKGFSLRRFHDAVLGQGPIPLPMLRRALLQ